MASVFIGEKAKSQTTKGGYDEYEKKIFAALIVAVPAISMLSTAAFAQTDVDPGQGEVELILDGVDIDGRSGAGIVAVSGEKLTLSLICPRNGSIRETGLFP